MNNKSNIEIKIEDTTVKGIITHRSSCGFLVKIIEPYQNISCGSHIPYFAREHITFDGEYGDERIIETLGFLYSIGKYLDKEMDNLKTKFVQMNDKIQELTAIMITDEKFKIKREELRKRLKAKEMNNIEYQKKLTPIRKDRETLELKIWELQDKYFEDNYPMTIPVGTREELLDIINGNKDYKS